MAFLHETGEDRLFISVITLAELRRAALKTGGRVKSALDAWLRVDLLERFSGRIVDITIPVAEPWGELMADAKQRGIALHAMDGFLAATARAHNQTLVTRNVKNFAPFGLPYRFSIPGAANEIHPLCAGGLACLPCVELLATIG